RRESIVPVETHVGEPFLRPHSRLVRRERIPLHRIGRHHHPIVHSVEEQLTTTARPLRVHAATGRNLPLAAFVWKRPYIHLIAPRLVRRIRQPTPVGRERGLPLGE